MFRVRCLLHLFFLSQASQPPLSTNTIGELRFLAQAARDFPAGVTAQTAAIDDDLLFRRPHRQKLRQQFVEAEPSLPFFTGPSAIEHAIDYAWECTRYRAGEIRLLARNGEIISAMPFGESGTVPLPVVP